MRNPHLWRNVGIAASVSGVVSLGAAFALPMLVPAGLVKNVCLVWAIASFVVGPLCVLLGYSDARAVDALRRGGNLIAQWRVDPMTWRNFVQLNKDITTAQHSTTAAYSLGISNRFSVREYEPKEGVEVVVGKSAIVLDGEVCDLVGDRIVGAALFEGRGIQCVRVTKLIYTKAGPMQEHYVFPVATAAGTQAELVVKFFNSVLFGRV